MLELTQSKGGSARSCMKQCRHNCVTANDITAVVTAVKDLMTGGAAIAAAVIAGAGLATWRRLLNGTTNYEVGRRLLRAVYKVREEVRYVRSPLMPMVRSRQLVQPQGWRASQVKNKLQRRPMR
jgi:hypothetical protein